MRKRPLYFLGPDKLDQDSEIFDYITELHDYLWDIVRAVKPGASGDFDYLSPEEDLEKSRIINILNLLKKG